MRTVRTALCLCSIGVRQLYCGKCVKVNGEPDGQSHASRRIRSSSSDAATARSDGGEADVGPDDDASTQPRRISDPICHAASTSTPCESTTDVLDHVTRGDAGSIGVASRPCLHISDQRRRLADEEVIGQSVVKFKLYN